MKKEDTTIKINKITKSRLDNLKIHSRETYEDVIKRVLSVLNVCKAHPNEARHMLEEFNRAKETTNSAHIPEQTSAQKILKDL